MIRRLISAGLLGLAILLAGCSGTPSGGSDFVEVPGIGPTRIDVPRPTSPAAVGGPTQDCAADGLPKASADPVEARVAALRVIGFFADRAAESDSSIAAEVTDELERYSGHQVDLDDRMLDLSIAAMDTDRVWWSDLESDVGPGNAVYQGLVGDLGHVSMGAFAPTGIQETWASETGPVTVTYQLAGSEQQLTPAYQEDWIDPSILATINDQIQGSGRRFELYRGFDQSAFIVALTSDERSALEHDRGWCFE